MQDALRKNISCPSYASKSKPLNGGNTHHCFPGKQMANNYSNSFIKPWKNTYIKVSLVLSFCRNHQRELSAETDIRKS